MAYLSRLIGVAWLLALSSAVGAVDCPTYGDPHTIAPSWPTNRSPSGNWSIGSGSCLGVNAGTAPTPSTFATFDQAVAAANARYTGPQRPNDTLTALGLNGAEMRYCHVSSGAGYSSQALVISISTTASACTPPPPPGCNDDFPAGVKTLAVASGKADSWVPPDAICSPGNCELIRIPNKYQRLGAPGAREYLVTYQGTGLDCSTPTADIPPSPTNSESCIGDWCRSPGSGENCGYHNDQYVCLDRISPDKCQRGADGSMICAPSAPMPPKPDNGTPGNPAVPNQTIDTCTGANSCQTNNYYTNTQVSGSSRPVPQGSGPSGSGTIDGEGPVVGDGSGGDGEPSGPTGSASGGGTCDSPPTCTHDDPVQCAMLEQQWKTRCSEIDKDTIEAAFGLTEDEAAGKLVTGEPIEIESLNADGGFSGASCPSGTDITVFGQHIELDVWSYACQMALLFAPIVMLMGYLGAARIIFKGVFK